MPLHYICMGGRLHTLTMCHVYNRFSTMLQQSLAPTFSVWMWRESRLWKSLLVSQFVLGVYGKSLKNVLGLIGDSCSTNKKFSDLAGFGFIGFSSHRFNLALRIWLLRVAQLLTKFRSWCESFLSLFRRLRYANIRICAFNALMQCSGSKDVSNWKTQFLKWMTEK